MYFRWYQAGSVTLNKGYNYLNLKVLNEMTDIERIYLASSDEERPALKDEAESAFVEKNKFKIKNEIIVEF